MLKTNLSWIGRASYASPGEQPSRTRESSPSLSEHSALYRPELGQPPAPVLPAKIKRSVYYSIHTKVFGVFDYLPPAA